DGNIIKLEQNVDDITALIYGRHIDDTINTFIEDKVNEPVKEPEVNEPIKEPIKELINEPINEPVKEPEVNEPKEPSNDEIFSKLKVVKGTKVKDAILQDALIASKHNNADNDINIV